MKIFKDIFNCMFRSAAWLAFFLYVLTDWFVADEVLSDIYPIKEIDDVIYEVEGKVLEHIIL